MKTENLSDRALVEKALLRTGGNKSELARLMSMTGVNTTQPSIWRWADGKPIVRNRQEIRSWLEDFVRRTSSNFQVSTGGRANADKA